MICDICRTVYRPTECRNCCRNTIHCQDRTIRRRGDDRRTSQRSRYQSLAGSNHPRSNRQLQDPYNRLQRWQQLRRRPMPRHQASTARRPYQGMRERTSQRQEPLEPRRPQTEATESLRTNLNRMSEMLTQDLRPWQGDRGQLPPSYAESTNPNRRAHRLQTQRLERTGRPARNYWRQTSNIPQSVPEGRRRLTTEPSR